MEATQPQKKPIHSLILDTGPLIKNAIPMSTIINSAEEIYTTPSILSEIRDQATRSRVQTTLMPFLKIKTPSPASYDAVIAFSKKTGDNAVLSRQDLGILALAYEIHCERNGGPVGLRDAPRQPSKPEPAAKKRNRKNKGKEANEDFAPAPDASIDEDVKEGEEANTTEETSQVAEAPVDEHVKDQEQEKVTEEVSQDGAAVTEASSKEHEQKDVNEAAPQNASASKEEPMKVEEKDTEGASQAAELVAKEPVAVLQQEPTEPSQTTETFTKDEDKASQADASSVEILANTPVENSQQEQAGGMTETPQLQETTEESAAQKARPRKARKPRHRGRGKLPNELAQEQTQPEHSARETSSKELTPAAEKALPKAVSNLTLSSKTPPSPPATSESDSDDESDWITPENLSQQQAKDAGLDVNTNNASAPQLDVATMTIDFAMQNVLLQMNLHLLSTNMQRIKQLKSKVLRCHACFNIVKQMDKQFCPRCGGATLQRVTCSTNAKGEFKIHLAKNFQYNKRGDKFSVPKPIAGTANGKWSGQGGGKGGWGRDLILAEDQKEYTKQIEENQRKARAHDLMDDDYLPGILTGDRGRAGGRPKVGAGKNVNSKRRF